MDEADNAQINVSKETSGETFYQENIRFSGIAYDMSYVTQF